MGRGKRPATYEDIEALPLGWVGEIIDDELWALPRPAKWHALVASVLAVELGSRFGVGRGGPEGWWLVYEPELHFGRQVLVPDLAGWRYERAPGLFERNEPFFDLAPDWVCEVLSPSTAGLDRGRKLSLYHQEGVSHAWLRALPEISWPLFALRGRFPGGERASHGPVNCERALTGPESAHAGGVPARGGGMATHGPTRR